MLIFFFFNDTATTEIYTLSLHDALPIWCRPRGVSVRPCPRQPRAWCWHGSSWTSLRSTCLLSRSEEHTSELQSQSNLVCRLLLEKKKTNSFLRRECPIHGALTTRRRITA